jgi:dolichol-phosphate mannosyltransferase
VRCIKRIGVTGLASACIEGIAASTAPYVAIMDADLQHDEKILPEMLNALRYENMDIVIGSRYILGGGLGQWSKSRVFVSYIATKLGRLILRADISDPMSGFFAMPRDLFEEIKNRISGIGFKILLDIFASSPRSLRFKEIPYEFSKRYAGKSKMGLQSVLDYLMLLANKTGHRFFHQDRQIPRKERETENWHYCSSAAPGLANPAKKTWV